MRIIPVLDLLGGQVVHARRGERERYRAVQSVLCDSAEPVSVAKAFRERLGLSEIYIADLDAIQGKVQPGHREVIETLAKQDGFNILLDAGVAEASGAQGLLALGVGKVVIGAETLTEWDALRVLATHLPAEQLVFSLDMRGGKMLSRCRELAALEPIEVLELLQEAGWREVILLDLERVGSGRGVDQELVARARAKFPEVSLLVGGGVNGMEALLALEALGVAGVLMATALHRGTINAQQIKALARSTDPS